MSAPRQQLADELLRRFAAALRSAQLYSAGHPIIARNLEGLSTAMQLLHALEPAIVIGLVGEEIIVDDLPIAKADTLGSMVRRLQQSGLERVTIERGVTADEIAAFLDAVSKVEPRTGDQEAAPFPTLPHIRVGRVSVEQRERRAASPTWRRSGASTTTRSRSPATSGTARRPRASRTRRWRGR